jgi:hypothetical protein
MRAKNLGANRPPRNRLTAPETAPVTRMPHCRAHAESGPASAPPGSRQAAPSLEDLVDKKMILCQHVNETISSSAQDCDGARRDVIGTDTRVRGLAAVG